MEIYNFNSIIGKIKPFFEKNGFIEKKSKNFVTFQKETSLVEQCIKFNSYGNSTIGTSFSITLNKIHEYYDKKLHGEHMGCTILCPTHFFSDEPYFNSEEKQINAINFVKNLYVNYAIPFFDKTSTIYGVIENLRVNYGIGIVRGDAEKGLFGYHEIFYELFLTRLIYPEQFMERIKYYKSTMVERINIELREVEFDNIKIDLENRLESLEDEYTIYQEKLLNLDVKKLRLELGIQV